MNCKIVFSLAIIINVFLGGWFVENSMGMEKGSRSDKEIAASTASTEVRTEAPADAESIQQAISMPREKAFQAQAQPEKTYRNSKAVIATSKGKIVFKLFYDMAPRAITDLGNYAKKGFFADMLFSRVEQGVGIAAGVVPANHIAFAFEEEQGLQKSGKGSLAIARKSVGSYYINTLYFGYDAQPQYEKNFTIIGEVVEGYDALTQLQQGDVIQSLQLVKE